MLQCYLFKISFSFTNAHQSSVQLSQTFKNSSVCFNIRKMSIVELQRKKTLIQFGWELPQYNISVLTSQGALVCSVSVVVSKLPSRLLYVC